MKNPLQVTININNITLSCELTPPENQPDAFNDLKIESESDSVDVGEEEKEKKNEDSLNHADPLTTPVATVSAASPSTETDSEASRGSRAQLSQQQQQEEAANRVKNKLFQCSSQSLVLAVN